MPGRPTTARVPAALALLLFAVALLGLCWALLSPVAQAPDEDAHFGYAQVVAEDLRLPDTKPGNRYSAEQQLVASESNAVQSAAQDEVKPEWSVDIERGWLEREARLPESNRDDGGHSDAIDGPNLARSNPPLYYLYESVAYQAGSGGHVLDRWFLMRIWSALLLLLAVAATWLLIGELGGPRPLLQLSGAAVVGMQPMTMFVSASVNPDALLIATWALALWLGVRILRRGLTITTAVALASVTAAAVLTKATSYALVPGVALVYGAALWENRRERRPFVLPLGAALAAFAIPVGAWLTWSRNLDRSAINAIPGGTAAGGGSDGAGAGDATSRVVDVDIANYLWQFYLPKLPFQTAIPQIEQLPVFDVWNEMGWAAFGWLEVRFPPPVYIVLFALTLACFAGAAWAVLRRRRRDDVAVVGFIGVVALTLLLGLHWIEYRSIVFDGINFNQGRYLLPLMPVLGLAVATTLALLRSRWQETAAGLVVGGMFVLQVFSLALVATRFYA